MVVIHEPQTSASNGKGAEPPVEPPSPQLSPFRVTILLIVLAGIAFGAWKLVVNSATTADAKSTAVPVYAPYVDVTLTPTYQFQLPADDPVSSAYLGFIVSDPSSPCTPSWGGFYTLAQADQTLELGARIAQLRKQGGTAMISFGGQANSELALRCTSTTQLKQAYMAPIQRYGVNTIDFDIEDAALANAAANTRRAAAVASIQKQMAKQHKTLHVWMTLPVSNQGLTTQGIAAVRSMLAAHVNLAGVNVLAMDFGSGEGASKNMFKTVRSSLYATHAQVQSLWRAAGLKSTSGFAWEHLGVTVMLGVNDITNEHFTVSDAQQLATFANGEGIPRVSAWSLNRDSECGAAFPTVGVVSNTCSGVLQSPLQFTKILSRLRGTKIARAQETNATSPSLGASTKIDNPATSPDPVWQSSEAYVAGYKVVWQGDIYQANWWSQGTAPGATATNSATAGPWLLIGPVPAGSTAFKPQLLASATQPAWSPTTVYHQGQDVSFDGLPYQARYYTKGDQPLDELPGNPSSPWTPLFTAPGEPTDTGIGSGATR
jgi:chitinase